MLSNLLLTRPRKILPAAFSDSAAEVPIDICMSQAIFVITICIIPK